MIGTLILSHGSLADELLAAARTIAGGLDGFRAVSLDWSDGFDEAQTKIREALAVLDQGEGVLILTDMFGGTPCNVALTFLQPGKVEIVTGVNLPMVVRLACLGNREMPIQDVAAWLRDKGRSSICLASDVQGHSAPAVRSGTATDPCAEEAPPGEGEGARDGETVPRESVGTGREGGG
ncbi:MAG: PTS sugar transporter subunit IIA [Acidobacteriota bacterium]